MARSESEKIKLFDFYRNWTMMLILVSAKLDLNIYIHVGACNWAYLLTIRNLSIEDKVGSGSEINLEILVLS